MTEQSDDTRRRKKPTAAERRRLALRDDLWPGFQDLVWSRHTVKGFTTIPRLLPLVMHLIKQLAPTGDPSKAYIELWCRAFDEGFVTINNEADSAYAAGYDSSRAERTWSAHMWQLEKLGFIKIKKLGNREIAYVLLINPLQVCSDLHNNNRVPAEWWIAFLARASEIGAVIPEPS